MEVLLLRWDAPLMSFGGVMVDQHGPTERFPGVSLLAGLFANALGYCHGDADKLEALQARIEYAARWDVGPKPLLDYHTVDLGQPKMCEPGWTTRGEPEHRGGGTAKTGTHIRYRHYWANGVMTLAVVLDANAVDIGRHAGMDRRYPDCMDASNPDHPWSLGSGGPCRNDGENLHSTAFVIGDRGNDEACSPSLQQLAQALREPARPLFIGRKTCLPSTPLLLGLIEAEDVLDALRQTPPARRNGQTPPDRLEACWPVRLGLSAQSREVAVYDRRDWRNQIHAGRRLRVEGVVEWAA